MTEIAVIVPVLGRPQRVAPLLDSLATSGADARAYFVVSEFDMEQADECEAWGVTWWPLSGERLPGDYARKVNLAYRLTTEPWLFLAADDLHFHHRWAVEALARAEQTGKRVIGTNDLGNPAVRRGLHSTHTLVARSYVDEYGTIDGPGVLHEGYDHQFVDNEFVETARHREEWAFAPRSVVEHLHPHWRKADHDSTYDLALAGTEHDRALFRQRRRMWRGGQPLRRHPARRAR